MWTQTAADIIGCGECAIGTAILVICVDACGHEPLTKTMSCGHFWWRLGSFALSNLKDRKCKIMDDNTNTAIIT